MIAYVLKKDGIKNVLYSGPAQGSRKPPSNPTLYMSVDFLEVV